MDQYNDVPRPETDPARIRERLEKMQAATGGILGSSPKTPYGMNQCEPMQEILSGRLRSRRDRAQRESAKAGMLDELLYLLERNPEVARILDLMDALRTDGI